MLNEQRRRTLMCTVRFIRTTGIPFDEVPSDSTLSSTGTSLNIVIFVDMLI